MMVSWWTQTGEASWTLMERAMFPEIPEVLLEKYAKYVTKQDLCDDPPMLFMSPTCSRVETDNPQSDVVFEDSQGCLIFLLDADGTVQANGICVANTLGEFLARMDLDNRSWFILEPSHIPRSWISDAKNVPGVQEYSFNMYVAS
jgi:hypothetical protein